MATLGGWFAQRGAELAKTQQPQQGSLGALGGQQPPMTGIDWDQHPIGMRPGEPGFDPNAGFNQILYPGGQLPPGWQPNTGGMNPNSPQPVPGMPPQKFDLLSPDPNAATVGMGMPGGWNGLGPGGYNQGNRGSGQPINQPMNPNQGHVTPFAGPGWDYNYDPTTGRGTQTNSRGQTTDYNYPASQLPNQGSLQSLGGGMNQSSMVNLRGPDGSSKAVPQTDLAHWLSRGAVRV
jgi:hypothetical protein